MLNWKLYTSTGIVNWTDHALMEDAVVSAGGAEA
jgi:hypothetical protein